MMKGPAPVSPPVFVDVRGYQRFEEECCLHLQCGYVLCFRSILTIGCPLFVVYCVQNIFQVASTDNSVLPLSHR
jgi:hypothetical protein